MNTIDPVCGMSVESTKASGQETFQGKTYFFCSTHCRDEFKKAPQKYTSATAKPAGCCGGHAH